MVLAELRSFADAETRAQYRNTEWVTQRLHHYSNFNDRPITTAVIGNLAYLFGRGSSDNRQQVANLLHTFRLAAMKAGSKRTGIMPCILDCVALVVRPYVR